MKVGFIGLGTMGASMAYNCLQGGNEMVVHDIRRESATRHLEAGADWADSPREVAEASEIVFTSLPGPTEVEAVGLGRGRHPRGHERGQGLLRPQHQHAHADPPYPRGGRCPGRPRPRRAGERRGRAARPHAIWPSGSAATRKYSTAASPCWTASATRPTTSAPSAAGPSPSWCTTALATSCRRRWPRCSLWALRPVWSRWPSGRLSARARRVVAAPSRAWPSTCSPESSTRPTSPSASPARTWTWPWAWAASTTFPCALAQLTLQEMTEALNRGWGHRDSRVAMLLQEERAGVEVRVDEELLNAVLEEERRAGG